MLAYDETAPIPWRDCVESKVTRYLITAPGSGGIKGEGDVNQSEEVLRSERHSGVARVCYEPRRACPLPSGRSDFDIAPHRLRT